MKQDCVIFGVSRFLFGRKSPSWGFSGSNSGGKIPGPTHGKGQLLTSSEFVCEPETLEVRDTF